MRKIILAAFLIMLPLCGQPMFADDAPPPANQPSDPAKIADIRKLMDLSGAGKLGEQVADQMIPAMQKAMPNVPQEFWDQFRKEIHPEDLVNLIVPIYDKHFTHDEILQLIAFYQSPIGKKLAAELPAISQESMTAGQQWGQQLAQKAIKEIQDKQQNGGNGN